MTTNQSMARRLEQWVAQGVTLLDFDAPWCTPCRAQTLIVKALEKTFTGKARVKIVDIERNREIAFKLGIQSIPTIILYKNGQEMKRFIGLQTGDTLSRALQLLIS